MFTMVNRRNNAGYECEPLTRTLTPEQLVGIIMTFFNGRTAGLIKGYSFMEFQSGFFTTLDRFHITPNSGADISKIFPLLDAFVRIDSDQERTEHEKHIDQLVNNKWLHKKPNYALYPIFERKALRVLYRVLLEGVSNPEEWITPDYSKEDLISCLTSFLFEGADRDELLSALSVNIKRDLAGKATS